MIESCKATIKRPWTKDEDYLLLKSFDLPKEPGESKWSHAEKVVQSRTGKQCRERYIEHLDPSKNRSPLTDQEINLLYSLVKTHPGKWTEMVKYFQGRTQGQLKNFVNSSLNKNRRNKEKNQSIPVINSSCQKTAIPEPTATAIESSLVSSIAVCPLLERSNSLEHPDIKAGKLIEGSDFGKVFDDSSEEDLALNNFLGLPGTDGISGSLSLFGEDNFYWSTDPYGYTDSEGLMKREGININNQANTGGVWYLANPVPNIGLYSKTLGVF